MDATLEMVMLISSTLNQLRLRRMTDLSVTSMTVGNKWLPLVQRLARKMSDGMVGVWRGPISGFHLAQRRAGGFAGNGGENDRPDAQFCEKAPLVLVDRFQSIIPAFGVNIGPHFFQKMARVQFGKNKDRIHRFQGRHHAG